MSTLSSNQPSDGSESQGQPNPKGHSERLAKVSMLVHPIRLLAIMAGAIPATQDLQPDCDELTALLAAGASLLGMQIEFVTVATDPSRPHEFNHVYPQLVADGVRFPIDVLSGPTGVEPKNVYRRKTWSSSGKGDRTLPRDLPVEHVLQEISAAAAASAKHPAWEEFAKDLMLGFFAVLHAMVTIELNGRSLGFRPPYFPGFSVEQIASTKDSLESAAQRLREGQALSAVIATTSLFSGAAIGPEEFQDFMKAGFEFIDLLVANEFGLGREIKDYFQARWRNLHY